MCRNRHMVMTGSPDGRRGPLPVGAVRGRQCWWPGTRQLRGRSGSRARSSGYVADVGARLAVIGGGNMGAALVGGLLASGWATAAELVVVEVVAARRTELADLFP